MLRFSVVSKVCRRAATTLFVAGVFLALAGPARAQLALPGAVPPDPVAEVVAPAKPKPKPRRDVAAAVRGPGEEAALDRTLLQNGGQSRLELERRDGKVVAAKLSLSGLSTTKSGQICKVDLTASGPIPATPLGRSTGLSRFELPVEGCKLTLDVLEGAVLMDPSVGVCEFKAADCRVEMGGLWGPPASSLVAQAREIEKARGQAEQTLRGNYKLLSQRASGKEAVKLVARDQAAFTSEREMACRFYDKENVHGYCGARYTQARAAQAWARINGSKDEPAQASGSADAKPKAHGRRRRQAAPPPENVAPPL
jgi:hypothetical protein